MEISSRFLYKIVGVLIGVCTAWPVTGSSELILNDQNASFRLDRSMSILRDEKNTFKIEQLASDPSLFFLDKNASLSSGITTGSMWLYFKIKNQSNRSRWYFEIGSPSVYEIDIYRIDSLGNYIHTQAGTKYDFHSRTIKSNQQIIPVDISKGETAVFYIRLKSKVFLRATARVASLQEIYQSNHAQDLFNGAYFGLLLALMLYNLFVFISLQDKTYFYYLLYVLFFGLNIACLKGYAIEFLWPEEVRLNSSAIFCALCILCGLTFTNSFLQLDQYAPRIYKLRWIVYLSLVVVVLLVMMGYDQWGYLLIIYNPAYVYHFVGITVYRKGFKPAKYYVVGFGVLVIGIVLFDMKEYGLLETNLFTDNVLQIGSACEAVILSLAMADKLNFYVKKKEEIQRQALLQATQFSHKLIQSQENERKRIAADLHDSLGQSIILIKNKVLLLKSQKDNSQQLETHLNTLVEMVTDTIQEVRNISYKLRPFQLDLLGLTHSIKSLVEEVAEVSKISFQIKCDPIDQVFSKDNEINIYRIVQECLNNMVKHSYATHGIILVRKTETNILLHIEDNGNGFVYQKKPEYAQGFGITGIKERLNILGGKLSITDALPHGTIIEINIPLRS
jgi:two-component system, sensor histidine kinase LadS